jgi:hypothetical protein
MDLKLGKLDPVIDKRTIPLKAVIRKELLPELPPSWNCHYIRDIEGNILFTIQDDFIFRNAGEDALGDCVKASRAHQTLVFEGFEQGKQIVITDDEVVTEYFNETGGGDTGLVLLWSLRDWKNDGWLVGDKTYTIYAFASCDIKDLSEIKHCVHLLGGVNCGIQVYDRDIEQFRNGETWHLTGNDGSLAGGHGIYIYAYDTSGLWCMTWGKSQKMTFDFFLARCDEAYGIVDNKDKWVGDSPLDVNKFDAYLQEITEGRGEPEGCSPFSFFLKGLGW